MDKPVVPEVVQHRNQPRNNPKKRRGRPPKQRPKDQTQNNPTKRRGRPPRKRPEGGVACCTSKLKVSPLPERPDPTPARPLAQNYRLTSALEAFIATSTALPLEWVQALRLDNGNRCSFCGETIEDYKLLKDHLQKHLYVKCLLCSTMFRRVATLRCHMLLHSPREFEEITLPISSAVSPTKKLSSKQKIMFGIQNKEPCGRSNSDFNSEWLDSNPQPMSHSWTTSSSLVVEEKKETPNEINSNQEVALTDGIQRNETDEDQVRTSMLVVDGEDLVFDGEDNLNSEWSDSSPQPMSHSWTISSSLADGKKEEAPNEINSKQEVVLTDGIQRNEMDEDQVRTSMLVVDGEDLVFVGEDNLNSEWSDSSPQPMSHSWTISSSLADGKKEEAPNEINSKQEVVLTDGIQRNEMDEDQVRTPMLVVDGQDLVLDGEDNLNSEWLDSSPQPMSHSWTISSSLADGKKEETPNEINSNQEVALTDGIQRNEMDEGQVRTPMLVVDGQDLFFDGEDNLNSEWSDSSPQPMSHSWTTSSSLADGKKEETPNQINSKQEVVLTDGIQRNEMDEDQVRTSMLVVDGQDLVLDGEDNLNSEWSDSSPQPMSHSWTISSSLADGKKEETPNEINSKQEVVLTDGIQRDNLVFKEVGRSMPIIDVEDDVNISQSMNNSVEYSIKPLVCLICGFQCRSETALCTHTRQYHHIKTCVCHNNCSMNRADSLSDLVIDLDPEFERPFPQHQPPSSNIEDSKIDDVELIQSRSKGTNREATKSRKSKAVEKLRDISDDSSPKRRKVDNAQLSPAIGSSKTTKSCSKKSTRQNGRISDKELKYLFGDSHKSDLIKPTRRKSRVSYKDLFLYEDSPKSVSKKSTGRKARVSDKELQVNFGDSPESASKKSKRRTGRVSDKELDVYCGDVPKSGSKKFKRRTGRVSDKELKVHFGDLPESGSKKSKRRTGRVSNTELKFLFENCPKPLIIDDVTPLGTRSTRSSLRMSRKRADIQKSASVNFMATLHIEKNKMVPRAARLTIGLLNRPTDEDSKKLKIPRIVILGDDFERVSWVVESESSTAESRANDVKWEKLLMDSRTPELSQQVKNSCDPASGSEPPSLADFEVVDMRKFDDLIKESHENGVDGSTNCQDPLAMSDKNPSGNVQGTHKSSAALKDVENVVAEVNFDSDMLRNQIPTTQSQMPATPEILGPESNQENGLPTAFYDDSMDVIEELLQIVESGESRQEDALHKSLMDFEIGATETLGDSDPVVVSDTSLEDPDSLLEKEMLTLDPKDTTAVVRKSPVLVNGTMITFCISNTDSVVAETARSGVTNKEKGGWETVQNVLSSIDRVCTDEAHSRGFMKPRKKTVFLTDRGNFNHSIANIADPQTVGCTERTIPQRQSNFPLQNTCIAERKEKELMGFQPIEQVKEATSPILTPVPQPSCSFGSTKLSAGVQGERFMRECSMGNTGRQRQSNDPVRNTCIAERKEKELMGFQPIEQVKEATSPILTPVPQPSCSFGSTKLSAGVQGERFMRECSMENTGRQRQSNDPVRNTCIAERKEKELMGFQPIEQVKETTSPILTPVPQPSCSFGSTKLSAGVQGERFMRECSMGNTGRQRQSNDPVRNTCIAERKEKELMGFQPIEQVKEATSPILTPVPQPSCSFGSTKLSAGVQGERFMRECSMGNTGRQRQSNDPVRNTCIAERKEKELMGFQPIEQVKEETSPILTSVPQPSCSSGSIKLSPVMKEEQFIEDKEVFEHPWHPHRESIGQHHMCMSPPKREGRRRHMHEYLRKHFNRQSDSSDDEISTFEHSHCRMQRPFFQSCSNVSDWMDNTDSRRHLVFTPPPRRSPHPFDSDRYDSSTSSSSGLDRSPIRSPIVNFSDDYDSL